MRQLHAARSMRRIVAHTFQVCVLVLATCALVLAKGATAEWCHLQEIQGYEAEAKRAHETVLKKFPVTADLDKLAVYVTSQDGNDLYIHSNYMPKGFENPTKLRVGDGKSRKPADIANAIRNLVLPSMNGGSPDDDPIVSAQIRGIIADVPVIFDVSAFSHEDFLKRPFGKIQNLSVVGDAGEPQTMSMFDFGEGKVPTFEAAPGLYGRLDDKQG